MFLLAIRKEKKSYSFGMRNSPKVAGLFNPFEGTELESLVRVKGHDTLKPHSQENAG